MPTKIIEYFNNHSNEWNKKEKEYMIYFYKSILEMLNTKKGSLLDVGCGTGRYAKLFSKNFNYTGIDASDNMIKLAKKKNCNVYFGDCKKRIPFKNNSFDIVVSIGVLEHLGDYTHALHEMKRVSKKEVIALNLNYMCPINIIKHLLNLNNMQEIIQKPKLLSPRAMTKIFKKVGFKNVKYKILMGIPPNSYFSFLNFLKMPIINHFGGVLIVSGNNEN